MSDATRLELIKAIERERNSRVIALVTGDRRGHETRIAGDVIPLLIEHLRPLQHVDRIDLFLYTPGGDSLAGWGIVNNLRQHCDHLAVLVPFRCLSCGTLIALGANEIMMGMDGLLGPVDPSVGTAFNPMVQTPQGQRPAPVSIEDLQGYINLVRDGFGASSADALASVIVSLSDKVHPLALGAVWRAREQSQQLTQRMLAFHLHDAERAESIAEYLLRHTSHLYTIPRAEAAARIGNDIVREPDAKLEDLMWSLYNEYQSWFELNSPWEPSRFVVAGQSRKGTFPRAAVESATDTQLRSHVFRTIKTVSGISIPNPQIPGVAVEAYQENQESEGWVPWPEGD